MAFAKRGAITDISVKLKASDIQSSLGGLVAAAGGLTVVAAPLLLGYQGLLWLQSGHWTPIALREAVSIFNGSPPIPDPTISWRGVQQIVGWLLDAPLSLSLWFLGFGLVAVGVSIEPSGRN